MVAAVTVKDFVMVLNQNDVKFTCIPDYTMLSCPLLARSGAVW